MLSATAISKWLARVALSSLFAMAANAFAEDAAPKVEADGAVTTPGARFPFSAFAASPQALARFQEIFVEGKASPGLGGPIDASRKFYDAINADRAARMRKLYPVEVKPSKIGGVPVDIVTPAGGKADKRRVLVNLHGGAFLWGAGSGGLVESIPVASLSGIEVVSVDYRQGPESTFPAASEDVESVYRALLKDHRAQDIGIYGCSAGGVLTAEAVAWLASKRLPPPGAIGIFCAGVVDMQGDSAFVGPMLMGEKVPTAASVGVLPYFKGADFNDPRVMPGVSPDMLARFPPTLLISGTRDFAMSSALRSDDLLTRAGVATELHVWEGMWHSFFSDPELPESKAAYQVMARFFQRHLGHADRH